MYGHQTYVMKRFNLEKYLHNIDRFQLTEAYMAPPMLVSIIQSSFDVKDLMKTVRFAGVGGAPIDAVLINKMRALLPSNATMTSTWGMTEIGVATSFRYGEDDETGSVGRLMRGMDGKLVDSNGKVVGKEGEPGELYCRTRGVMLGYRNMPFPEDEKEWFRTGDVCCFRGGKLYIVGRAKELIKVKGWQVAPAELEAVLLRHPEIVDAAVVGTMANDGVSEVPRAYVIHQKKLREDEMITAEEVYKYARVRLASYKALDGGVCFVEEIPRTPSGKIQRSKLSRMDQYRRSVTAVLLASTSTTAPQDLQKVAEIKDRAIRDVEMAEPMVDTPPHPRRSSRLSSHRSQGSTGSDERRTSSSHLRMRQRTKPRVSSGSSDGISPTRLISPMKVQKKRKSKFEDYKRLGKTAQAAVA